MVYLNTSLFCKLKERRKAIGLMDSLRVYVRGGNGGTGLPQVGGIGGPGGNVIVVSQSKVRTLHDVRSKNPKQRYIAESGGNSRKTCLVGERGKDVEVKVPVGVTVLTDSGEVVGDLTKHGQSLIAARGGMGGNENSNFLGLPGERRSVKLDLKLIADIGLVGFPNAGKSTLLKRISRAKPKIASYPFTTIRPNLGIAEFPDARTISLADLPGLIEGAHLNEGMGHKFLKHVERTKLHMFMIDVDGFQFKSDTPYRTPLETFLLLNRELELYRDDLIDKPAICVVTKMDRSQSDYNYRTFLEGLEKAKEEIDSGRSDKVIDTIEEDINKSENKTDANPEIILPNRLVNLDEVVPISAKFSPKTVDYLKERLRYWLDYHQDMVHKNTNNLDQLELDVIRKLEDRRNFF